MNSRIANPGSVLGARYALEERIAVGGMGEVWRATDQVLERVVAVKILRPDLIDSGDFRARFRVEARLAAGLSHPGIAHVYDYAEDVGDGQRIAFLVMEFVDGQPLSDQLARRDPPDLGRVVSLLEQTAEALGAAHALGVVHRDVKPGNLLITTDGRVKITDFGIARAINSAAITEVGQVIGTVRYMSPEQAKGEEATPASDVYSLAVVGFEMLSGATPFTGDTPAAIAMAHVLATPPALPASVPGELRSLIARSLGKMPEQRPSDGAAFASAVRRIAIDPPASSVSTAVPIVAAPLVESKPTGEVQPTAVAQQLTTPIDRAPHTGVVPTQIAPAVPSAPATPLLGDGWLKVRRRRRRIAGWGTAVAVAACLLILVALNRGGNGGDRSTAASSVPSSTITAVAPAVAPDDLVTVDPATYRGLTEPQARAALTEAGMTPVTKTAASTVDLAGVVIDVQPNGPIARGSNVTIVLGDGTVASVTDTPAEDRGNGNGNGDDNGNGRSKDGKKNND